MEGVNANHYTIDADIWIVESDSAITCHIESRQEHVFLIVNNSLPPLSPLYRTFIKPLYATDRIMIRYMTYFDGETAPL